jgi:phage/plasmid primase-like uncharacterized protein
MSDDSKYLNNLQAEMSMKGLPCASPLIADGRIHRYSTKGMKSKDEWYCIYPLESGVYFALYGSWRSSLEFKYEYRSWEGGEELYYKGQVTERIEKFLEESREFILNRKELALAQWEEAQLCLEHPYLNRKRVSSHGLKVAPYNGKEYLLIPILDEKGEFLSIQYIDNSGEKRFYSGIPVQFGRYYLGTPKKASRILVVEGYATGASIYEATGESVAVAFSAMNCVKVGHELQQKYPDKEIVLCQDLGKAGEECATKWRGFSIGKVIKPNFLDKGEGKDKDFNDLSVLLGKEEVKKQLISIQRYEGLNLSLFMEQVLPPIEPMVEGLIRKGSINQLVGSPGSGKSWLAMDLALCFATGYPWLGLQTTKARVCYIDSELPDLVLQDRLTNAVKRLTDNGKRRMEVDPQHFLLVSRDMMMEKYGTPLNIYSQECRDTLMRTIEDYDVIILDNLSELIDREGLNIEGYRQEDLFVSKMKTWLYDIQGKGKTTLIINHLLKDKSTTRGSSLIGQFIETDILLARKDKFEVTEREGYGDFIRFEIKKNRNFANPKEPFPIGIRMIKDPDRMSFLCSSTHGWLIESELSMQSLDKPLPMFWNK